MNHAIRFHAGLLCLAIIVAFSGCQPEPPTAATQNTSASHYTLDKDAQDENASNEEPRADYPVSASKPADFVATTNAVTAGKSSDKTANQKPANKKTDASAAVDKTANPKIVAGDWPQWGGTSYRNNVPIGKNIPDDWEIGEFDRKTGKWISDDAHNVKWVSRLGSQTYGNPVVADGRVYVGTNNGAGHLKRYPFSIDLGCMLCFAEKDGKFLWQHSSEKLPTGRVHDWELQGVCSAPLVEGERLWFVSNRGLVVCLDTQGYYDGEDDGPVKNQWGRLFLVNPLVSDGLDRNTVSSEALRALLEENGVSLDGRIDVEVDEEGKQWTITIEVRDEDGETKTTFVRVRKVEGQLHVSKVATDDASSEGMKIFSVADSLQAGIESGSPSKALRALFKTRGFELPMSVNFAKKENQWEATAEVDGAKRQIRLRMQGPNLTVFKLITPDDKEEADTVWEYDMMKNQQVSQHNMCSCSITSYGDIIFVNTSNGVDESHINIPSPRAASFMAMDKNTGEVLWTDNSPGVNILHGQWSSPTVAVLGGVPQAIFAGGDGWVYSFKANRGKDGKGELLWKFDGNPKESKWILGGRGTRNNIICTPVVYDGLVYFAVGQDPEHGEGVGHLWCLNPNRRGDVSAELAVYVKDRMKIVPHKRLQAVIKEEGHVAIDNPNSAVVWHYSEYDINEDGEVAWEEQMHRSLSTAAIKDDVMYIADFSGLVHCLNAKTGKPYWTHDLLAQSWGSPLIVDDKVYIGDEDGDVAIFKFGKQYEEPIEIPMDNSVYSTPVVANGVLYISNKSYLFAIANTEE